MHFLNSPSQKENISQTPLKSTPVPQPNTPQVRRFLRFNTEATLSVSNKSTKHTEKTFFPEEISNIKYSNKENGIVSSYAAATDQGLVRNYNEDRVSIILNILKPPSRSQESWPFCSFFGIYDGHGGSKCADFLRDNLHQFIVCSPHFPFNASDAILEGFRKAETIFNSTALSVNPPERSGSCAIVVLVVGNTCYVANVGDSRAILSGRQGNKVYTLSRDHKPCEENERKRIEQNGGSVYQSTSHGGQTAPGPFRVLPGRLSVSRTIGDVLAKSSGHGGNSKVVIGVPEIKIFSVVPEHDFIIIGSDGIFDKLNNREVIQAVWNTAGNFRGSDMHRLAGNAATGILTAAMEKRSLDNLTAVLIGFHSFSQVMHHSQMKNCFK